MSASMPEIPPCTVYSHSPSFAGSRRRRRGRGRGGAGKRASGGGPRRRHAPGEQARHVEVEQHAVAAAPAASPAVAPPSPQPPLPRRRRRRRRSCPVTTTIASSRAGVVRRVLDYDEVTERQLAAELAAVAGEVGEEAEQLLLPAPADLPRPSRQRPPAGERLHLARHDNDRFAAAAAAAAAARALLL